MQITDPGLLSYLRHRLGEERLHEKQCRIWKRALELNMPAPDLSATFGKPSLNAYVGFIDLAGFSATTQGKQPDEIAAYLEPFLSRVIDILRKSEALIDKTIGDEIMFVLPEKDEEQGFELLLLGQLMGELHDFAFEFVDTYPFRIGLSYGLIRFFCVKGCGYTEWTTVGEAVHVAKRLQSLSEVRSPEPIIGVFGMQISADSRDYVETTMRQRLSYFAGFASRFDHKFADQPASLKGVGKVLYALLLPKAIKN